MSSLITQTAWLFGFLIILTILVKFAGTAGFKGWFGSEKQRQWTQQIYRAKHRFQNPLHQNYLHIRALAQFLGVSEKSCRSLVFFIGDAELKTPMPSNVMNCGLLPWIKNHTEILLDPSTVLQANSALTTLQLSTNRRKASRAHLRSIHARNA